MNKTNDIKKWYAEKFKHFENSLNGEANHPVHLLRKDGFTKFNDLQFPTTRHEEWKYTNISQLLKHSFEPVSKSDNVDITKEDIKPYVFEEYNSAVLVFLNGHFLKELSSFNNLPAGVICSNMSEAVNEHYDIIEKHLGKYAEYNDNIFTALSTAFTNDGLFLHVPENVIIEEPIQVIFLTDGRNVESLSQPRNLFVAEKFSQATIIETYAGIGDITYLTNSVTEVYTAENAFLKHIRLQKEKDNAFHIATVQAHQERNSNYKNYNINFGGALVRNNINTKFNGEGGEATLNGLSIGVDNKLIDNHTEIDHAVPHCESHELYKGVYDDKSRGVFNGKVFVRKDAQKTNAFQENKNVILSDYAKVDTKPQLEIFADDVRCTHGATIGRLDDNSLFYLRSRGIDEKTARSILIYAFASDVIETIGLEPVQHKLNEVLQTRLLKTDKSKVFE